jgi:hypothetical protein
MRPTMGFVVVFLLGLALGIGGTLGVRAVTDESTPSSRSEVREGLAEEWGEVYAKCVEEAETPADDYFEEDDRTPAVTTEAERLGCNRRADAVLP